MKRMHPLKIILLTGFLIADLLLGWQFYCLRERKYLKFKTSYVGRDKVQIDFGPCSFSIQPREFGNETKVFGCFASGKVVLHSPANIPQVPSIFEDWLGDSDSMKMAYSFVDNWLTEEGRINFELASSWKNNPYCAGQFPRYCFIIY